ncbi:MAG: DNA topoisomerase I, partial [Planctomycetaceae bacterium]|nr:DNA topoisomerase I [Planctomycetaceae bacterium]
MPLPKEWLIQRVLAPVMRPAARFIVGMIAIPLLRMVRARVQPDKEWDEEFERDLEQWFRSSIVLFLATKNVEQAIANWMDIKFQIELDQWWVTAGRLMLAIGVVETMPDQQLFSIIHPGPSKLKWV